MYNRVSSTEVSAPHFRHFMLFAQVLAAAEPARHAALIVAAIYTGATPRKPRTKWTSRQIETWFRLCYLATNSRSLRGMRRQKTRADLYICVLDSCNGLAHLPCICGNRQRAQPTVHSRAIQQLVDLQCCRALTVEIAVLAARWLHHRPTFSRTAYTASRSPPIFRFHRVDRLAAQVIPRVFCRS